MADALLERIPSVLSQLRGWCSVEKATALITKIREERPSRCVEIGVFGGASLIPQALALKELNAGGVIFGVDPWRVDAAIAHVQRDANLNWWSKVDFAAVHAECMAAINIFGVASHCRIVHDTALHAANMFAPGSIDFLHLDGNHAEEEALATATAYLPLVRPGGLIFFDDIWWSEVDGRVDSRKAILHLQAECTVVGLVGNDCMFLRKTTNTVKEE